MDFIPAPYIYNAKLIRVVDGDTIVVLIDFGLGLTQPWHVRLLGINAPELNTVEGKTARSFLTSIIESKPLTVRSVRFDKYGGRIDGDVFAGDINLSQTMINNGMAVKYR